MGINIFDDEVLKRNKRFISEEIEENKTPISKTEENKQSSFTLQYDKELQKAIENPKESIEIGLSSVEVRTPSAANADPRTNEVTFEGFEREIGEVKWNPLVSPNVGITKQNINIDLANRESLDNTYSIEDVSNSDISLEGFEKLDNGKWRAVGIPNKPVIQKTSEGLEIREKLSSSYSASFTDENNEISILKLRDIEGNLIDPDDAIEEEEYELIVINRRDTEEIKIGLENKQIRLEGFEKVGNKWRALSAPEGLNEEEVGVQKTLDIVGSRNPDDVYFSTSSNILAEAKTVKILKLQDSSGRLIDPDDAIEEEEYTPMLVSVARRDKSEIVSQDERLVTFLYPEGYDEGALLTSPSSNVVTKNIDNLDVRISKRSKEMKIFLFMLFPYIGTSVVQDARGAISDPDILGLAVSSTQNLLDLLRNMRYFTPFEMVKYFGHNFYTMHFLKEMTIKYPPGRFPSGAPNADKWDGRPDIMFGAGSSALFYMKQLQNLGSLFRKDPEDLGDGSQFLTQLKDGNREEREGGGLLPESRVAPLSPRIEVTKKRSVATNIFSSGRGILSDNPDYAPDKEQRNAADVVYTLNEFKFENGKWQSIPENDSNKIEYTYGSSVFGSGEKADVIDSKTGWGPEEKIESYFINNDVSRINQLPFQYLDSDNPPANTGPNTTGETIEVAIKRGREIERNDPDSLQIGSILVAPIVDETFEDTLPRFHIPFEFNPEISEASLEAEYQSTEVLSRIGSLFSFSGVGSQTITLTTEYVATSHDETEAVANDGNSWMNYYTLERIQAIEYAYRSLVLPHYPDSTSIEQGYRYVKPPLLRVIIGGANENPTEGPYANFLTYGKNSVVAGRLDSAERVFGSHARLKSFIATGVQIEKDLKESPIVLDKKGRIVDTMKFKVTLNLTEVAPNYMDSIPDYKRLSELYTKSELAPSSFILRRSNGD